MSARSLRLVKMAVNQPVSNPVFTDSEDEQISDTESDYIPSDNNLSSIESRYSLDDNLLPKGSPIIPISEPITYSSKILQSMPTHPSSNTLSKMLSHPPSEILSDLPLEIPSSTSSTTKVNDAVEMVSGSYESKRLRRKHACPFCNLVCGNFARHLERNHNDETSVQEFLCLERNSTKRKKLIDRIRREGDFCTSTTVPVMHQNKLPTEFIVCKFCRGYYSKKSLRRHAKHCYFNPDPSKRFNAQIEGQTLMAGHFGPNDILRISGVLNMLRADNVSLVLKKDPIICEVGRRYIRRHKEKHLLLVAKRHMRRLARLLIAARHLSKNDAIKLIDILTPKKFKILAKATQEISGYNEKNRSFDSPSLALQMGTIIKSAVNTAYSVEIQKPDTSSERLEQLKNLCILIDTDWAHEISSEASQSLAINKFNKPTLIPLAKSIAAFEKYLKDTIVQTKVRLVADSKNLKSYRELIEVSFCYLLIFNKRRVGELQRITLVDFTEYYSKPASATDFEKMLTESEKILYQSLKRVVIRGKRGRGVPVLFDRQIVQTIEFLISLRNNFYLADNPFLFGLPGSENPIAGSSVMRKHARRALGDVSKASLLTSTKLRKHLATMVQILNMNRNELEQLATFMGHTEKTHAQFYRLPDDIYQTAKVSKLLMMVKSSSIEQYRGKSLSEIEIGDNLVEVQSDEDNSDGESETVLKDIEIEMNAGTSNVVKDKRQEQEINFPKKKRTKRILVPWTKEQKCLTEQYFKQHITKKKAPKKNEILPLIEKYPKIFANKSWLVIKVFVQNKYMKTKNNV